MTRRMDLILQENVSKYLDVPPKSFKRTVQRYLIQ